MQNSQSQVSPEAPKQPDIVQPEPNLVGIRGWLLFLAIILGWRLLTGWLQLGFFGLFMESIANYPFYEGVTTAGGQKIPETFGGLFWGAYGLLFSLCSAVLYVWLWAIMLRFEKKRATTPPRLIKYFKANFAVATFFLVIGVIAGFLWPELPDLDVGKLLAFQFYGFLGACGGIFIWGNYLKRSKRVKATFVN
jgi:hypothetical protein